MSGTEEKARRVAAPDAGRERWQGAIGPVVTAVLAATLFWLRSRGVTAPNPVLFFANCIVVSAFLGGLAAGLASVAITVAFALVYWSIPGLPFQYTPVDRDRLVILVLTMPPLGLLVGWLRAAHDRKRRELADQNVALANELRRREALEAMQRDVDHILRHDLRNPLNGIVMIPQLLLDEGDLSPRQREMLSLVAAAGRKMLAQINRSLVLRKVEEGSYSPRPKACSPEAIVRDNFSMLAPCGCPGQAGLEVRNHGPSAITTDPALLDAIVANLLRNALEASDEGAPVVAEIGQEDGRCVIAIRNSQPVPPEIRPRFFEKYVTAGKVGGTGLGTYSARVMTRALGGDIVMETSDQAGTTVTVRIPLATASAGEAEEALNQA